MCESPEITPIKSRKAPESPPVASPTDFRENFINYVVKRRIEDDIILLEPLEIQLSPKSPAKRRNFKEISKRTSPVITRSRSVVLIPSPSKNRVKKMKIEEEEETLSCISVVKRKRVNKCVL